MVGAATHSASPLCNRAWRVNIILQRNIKRDRCAAIDVGGGMTIV
jgi:hypothetical protein